MVGADFILGALVVRLGKVFGEFPDGYALTGYKAIEKILLTPRTGVMPRVFPRWVLDVRRGSVT